MRKTFLSIAIILGVGFISCTTQNSSNEQAKKVDESINKKTKDMKNLISIVEIPTADFTRALAFYKAILNISIEEMDMEGVKMGLFPNDGKSVFVQLIHGSGYNPSSDGTIVYLNAGDDLQIVADKIESNGGKVIVPKTAIGPDMGFYAMFTDTEGNKIGLHSIH